MAEIKIPEPKYATTRKSIDTIMPPESRETIRDNKVVVRERRIGKDGKSGILYHAVSYYDPTAHAVSDVWGR